MTEKESHL